LRPQRRLFLLVLIAALASAGVWLAWSVTAAHRQEENLVRVTKSAPPPSLGKEEIAFLIGQPTLEPGDLDGLTLRAGEGRVFLVESTLDPGLQGFLADLVNRAQAPVAAAVVLEPASGRVLALASFNRLGKETNYALSPAFPAASIIKIVTAAAAMEGAGLTPSSLIPYNGRPYTLYRSQLRERKTRWTRQPTLAESFARSLNPVFGKLALNPIGSAGMKEFVHRFGFNQTLRFELPIAPSRVEIPRDNTFALAAIGCGFNRNTTLSPLHGAMLAAAVVNDGVMMEPTIIERLSLLDDGRPVEQSIGHGETKQLLFLHKDSVPMEKRWTFDARKLPWDPEKLETNVGIPVSYRIKNTEKAGLGMFPFSDGKVRVFQLDGHKSTIFLGEDSTKLVPVGEKMEIYIGDSRDIVVTQHKMREEHINIRRNKKNRIVLYDTDELIKATAENFKDKPAMLTMIQHIPGQWDMEECNMEYRLEDAYTLEFELQLPSQSKRELVMHYHRRNVR